ncbi:MAG: hydrogenase maturation protease [Calditrichota bacterium]|jgi:hydrogenase maturation protease
MSDKHILVLGLGNLLLSDEGLGIHVIRELQKKSLPKNVSIIDGGTGGFELIRYFRGMEKVIIIDALKSDDKPGSVFRFTPDEFRSSGLHPFSAHQGGLSELLNEIKKLDPSPEVIIYGIVPGETKQYNLELSRDVKRSIPALIFILTKEIENGGN